MSKCTATYEKTLGRHSGESLSIFHSFVACTETNKYFEKALCRHSGESLPILSYFVACVKTNTFGRVF